MKYQTPMNIKNTCAIVNTFIVIYPGKVIAINKKPTKKRVSFR